MEFNKFKMLSDKERDQWKIEKQLYNDEMRRAKFDGATDFGIDEYFLKGYSSENLTKIFLFER